MHPSKLLDNYAFVVSISLILGLATGGSPAYQSEITILALAIMMALSLSEVDLASGLLRRIAGKATTALLLNYALLTGLILGISVFFDGDIRSGWILMAAVPSAIAVVPFSYMLKADTRLALVGTTAIYFLALLFAPAITVLALSQGIDTFRLIFTIIVLIIIPILLSRIPTLRIIEGRKKTPMINLCFGVLIFVMTGANNSAFAEEPSLVFWVSVASFLRTFVVGLAIFAFFRQRGTPSDTTKVYVLFSSYKNLGLTAALAMTLISYEAAIPATICIPFELVWLIFLKRFSERGSDVTDRDNRPEKN